MRQNICKNCRHFNIENREGECRRYPPHMPTSYEEGKPIFPPVNKFNWCGEMEKNERFLKDLIARK